MATQCLSVPNISESAEPLFSWLATPLADIMIRFPITAGESDTVRVVQARMHLSGAGHLPVIGSDDRPIGLITARDLARTMPVPITILRRAELNRLLALPVTEVMSTPPVTLPADATLETAVKRMVDLGIGAMMVVDAKNGRLVGLITRSIIARLVAGRNGETV